MMKTRKFCKRAAFKEPFSCSFARGSCVKPWKLRKKISMENHHMKKVLAA
jgi:hypothetical protein